LAGGFVVLRAKMRGLEVTHGCIERFFRTLKEQLLWVRRFADLEELRTALFEFRDRYNHHWIMERLDYRTPAQARRDFQLELGAAA
jgi:putative transposase